MSLAEREHVTIHFNHFTHHVDLKNKTLEFSSGPRDNKTISTASYQMVFGADGAFSSLSPCNAVSGPFQLLAKIY